MNFSENLKEARVSRGFSQKEIADLLGIDRSTYVNYEAGKREPNLERLRALAMTLGVSADYLLDVRPTLTKLNNR